ncbi:flippase-like domain-containing protein [candidate division WOR-3 bacterium]|nr:flippase-like domain-containing protein [candidate division WOR-3 bacterium]
MRKIKIIIGLSISAVFLWLAFLKINFKELTVALESANYSLIIFAAFVNGLSFIPRAYRWKLLLKPLKNTRFGNTFGILSIGFMANSVLPARGGEFIRAFAIGRTEKISKSASFATIIVERVIDMITLLIFLVISISLLSDNNLISKIFWMGLILAISAVIFLAVLRKNPKIINMFVSLSPRRFKERVKKFLEAFIKGLEILNDFKTLLYTFLQSLLIWSCYAVVYYILFISFGFRLSVGAAFLVMAICSLGISIPSSPGFIGTYHYFLTFSLGLFQIPKSIALSFAIVAWAVNFLPVVVIGLVALNKLGISLTVKE